MDGRGALDWQIKPMDPANAAFVGPALTAFAYPADVVGVFGALGEAQPGDVVIVANDGHKFIKAEVDGIAHRAREAVLGANGWWYGAWRKAEGDGLLSAMFPEHISAPTWKVDDQ